jgi:hypothetical protein
MFLRVLVMLFLLEIEEFVRIIMIILLLFHLDQLVNRGYNKIDLIKTCKIIGNIDRNSLLPYKDKQNNLTIANKINIMYFHLYNYNLNFSNIINNSFNSILYNNNLI